MRVILDAHGQPAGDSVEAKLERLSREMYRRLERLAFDIPDEILGPDGKAKAKPYVGLMELVCAAPGGIYGSH